MKQWVSLFFIMTIIMNYIFDIQIFSLLLCFFRWWRELELKTNAKNKSEHHLLWSLSPAHLEESKAHLDRALIERKVFREFSFWAGITWRQLMRQARYRLKISVNLIAILINRIVNERLFNGWPQGSNNYFSGYPSVFRPADCMRIKPFLIFVKSSDVNLSFTQKDAIVWNTV
jgi:hypothetical protein